MSTFFGIYAKLLINNKTPSTNITHMSTLTRLQLFMWEILKMCWHFQVVNSADSSTKKIHFTQAVMEHQKTKKLSYSI